jgi:raffinose/stachyose/melibiose transport system substrate-binding protein
MKRNAVILVVAVLALTLVANSCSKKDASAAGSAQAGKQGQVYLLNFKPEIDQQWKDVAAAFTKETGIPMKVVTAASGTYESTLRAEISKSQPPTLFNINGPVGYQNWKDFCADLSGSQIYQWLTDKSLAITAGSGVYGIPYAVETYGIIYNNAILSKYFALSGRANADIKSAADINNFAKLKAVVEDITAHKKDLGIGGAFASTSFAPGEDWRWQTHLMNMPIYYEYKDAGVSNENEISFKYNANFKNIFDLYIQNSITDPKLLGAKTVGDSMSEFALGQVAFVQNGNWAWGQISGTSGNTVQAADVKFLPIYTGVSGEEKQGLCTGTENFISLNSQAAKADQDASLKLLEWVFGSDTGKKMAVSDLGFVAPFSTFTPAEKPDDPLVKEMDRFLGTPGLSSVAWDFTTFPSQEFKNALGQALYQYAMGNEQWDKLVSDTIASWKNEKAASN